MKTNTIQIKESSIISRALTEDALIVCTEKWKWICEINSEIALPNGNVQFTLKGKCDSYGQK